MTRYIKSLAAAAVLFVPLGSTVALAQDAQGSADQQAAAARSTLTAEQLDNLVAPLALYPDPLLSQVLAASTYPLEVVEASQWLTQNPSLTGTALMDAAKLQNWDPSVQAMVAFPDVLTRLNQDIRWTTDLGNAFLGQQSEVMAAVQRLRRRAVDNGKLRTTPQQKVTDLTEDGQTAVAIQPADPQVIYVPTYDPTYVWGAPAYGYYPSLFYPTYGFGWGFGIPIGGFYGGWGGWGGYGWGFNWFRGGGIFINGGFFNHYGYGGGFGYRGGFGQRGFAGNRGWSHDYARSSRATGTAGYSRSYNTASGNRAGAGANNRSAGSVNRAGATAGNGSRASAGGFRSGAAAGGASRAATTGQGYRGGASGSTNGAVNRGYAGQSAARSYSGQSAARSYSAPTRSYSAPASRSYSAPSRSYSAPAQRSSGSVSHSSGGGGGGFHGGGGGGGGSHGGGRR